MKLIKIYEASEQAIKKFIEDNEEWIKSSSSPEEQQQKINYLMKIGSLTSDDNHLFSNYGNKQKLKNLKLQSRESYGWLDELSPEEKEIELNDPNLKPEYDFHKNLMKTNFQNPKSTDLKLYYSRNYDFYLQTDEIKNIINYKTFLFEFKEMEKNIGINKSIINSKIFLLPCYSNSDIKIVNSTLLVSNDSTFLIESFNESYHYEILNSNILISNKRENNDNYSLIRNSKIINSILKCKQLRLSKSQIIDCEIDLSDIVVYIFNAKIENLKLKHTSFKYFYPEWYPLKEFSLYKDVVYLTTMNGVVREISLSELQQKFAKK